MKRTTRGAVAGLILAGDVGGTKTSLALYRASAGRFIQVRTQLFRSRDFSSIEEMVGRFLVPGERVEYACVGVAGPVFGGRSSLTNLPWVVDEGSLARCCGASRARLMNDLQAMAFSVPFLEPGDVGVLRQGILSPGGTVAVIAAGTGLGEAFLVWEGTRYIPVASEGGHVDFAPRDDREVLLRKFLAESHGRVSLERVLSGAGLFSTYRFVREVEGVAESPDVGARLGAEEPAHVIVREGQGKRSPACREALLFFTAIYGAAAGNLVLQSAAAGGVYLGGGIAPAMIPLLKGKAFTEAFLAKGRFRGFLSGISIKVILRQEAILIGAARYARQQG